MNRQSLSLLGFSATLVLSSMLCDVEFSESELDHLPPGPDSRFIGAAQYRNTDEAATSTALHLTLTAQASITPTVTLTLTPTITPTPTPSQTPVPPALAPGELPPALFSVRDGGGDTYLCDTGEAVDDPAGDIIEVEGFETQDGLLASVELGVPADQTYANAPSVSVRAAFASPGESAYTIIVNEIHAGEARRGTLDENSQNVLPDTEYLTYIDEQGKVWFLMPGETTFIQFASFYTPTDDLLPENKICDLFPNGREAFTIHPQP